MSYEAHPFADQFPMMSDGDLKRLADDIAENGLKEWGVIHEGMILDGRNRNKACEMAGVEMQWGEVTQEEIDADFDPLAYVVSLNLHRRQLTNNQRAVIAGRLATMKRGGDHTSDESNSPNGELLSRDDAAALLQVTPRSVDRAKSIIKNASADVVKSVESNELPLSTADKLAKAVPDKREQSSLIKQGPKAVREHLKQITAAERPADEKPNRARKNLSEIVSAFRRSETKADDLRVLIEELDPSFKALIKEWLS